jgi:glycosyltransferase involved in cell wall biosynthesis
MRRADFFLLSVLPQAAQNIVPPSAKCIQLWNAIDLSKMATEPPWRSTKDPELHLAFLRSKFVMGMGLDVVIRAAELLKERGCSFFIHLVGEITQELLKDIEQSFAKDRFKVHGFIKILGPDFFKQIHVGLVPFKASDDLSYTFPIKVIEHLSQGSPVIVSRLPGTCSMIRHEYNGIVVNPDDPEDLAAAIERLQVDRALWQRLSRNALRSALKYETVEKNRRIFRAIEERMQSCW